MYYVPFQGLFVGMIIERFGERPLTIIGSLLALAGSVCSSFATKVNYTVYNLNYTLSLFHSLCILKKLLQLLNNHI